MWFLNLVVGSLLAVAAAASPLSDWRYQKPIVAPAVPVAGFVDLTFDNEVFAGAQERLGDLRVFDSGGREVPYVLATEAQKYQREPRAVRLYNRGTTPGVSSTFSLDLGEQPGYHNQLTITTDSRNFRREVVLEGSTNESDWVTIAGTRFIYDYTLEFTARDTTVRYPEANFRYLRVVIKDNGEKPINIQGVELFRETSTSARSVSYTPAISSQQQFPELKVSQVVFDFGARGLPTSSLTLATRDVNFNRTIALEGSNDAATWSRVLGNDVIFSYQTPQFQGNKLTLAYPEAGYRYLRLTIFNKDDQPITISSASVTGLLRKLVFNYQPGQSYQLYYGNPKAAYPQYDLQNYLAYYDEQGRGQVTLGPQVPNPSYVPAPEPVVPFTERYAGLLVTALVLAVGVVGWLIFRLLRKVGPA